MGNRKITPLMVLTTGALCAMFLCIASVSQAKEVVRLSNGEWPPFTSKSLKHYGVYSHIVTEAFAVEGIVVEYEFLPWSRGYAYTKSGKHDGSLTWAKTPEKEKEVFFSDPVFFHTKVFFHLKSFAFDWNTFVDLRRLTIGTTAEYTYGADFSQAVQNGEITIEIVTSDIQNLKKLLGHRIYLFPSDIDVGYYLLNANFTPEKVGRITHHAKPLQKVGTCVIFTKTTHKKSQRVLTQFNQGLKKLKESGTYDQIIQTFRRSSYKFERSIGIQD